MAKAAVGQGMEALAKSLEERRALEGELDQIHNIAQVVVSEVFKLGPSTKYTRRPAGGGPERSSSAHLRWHVL